jgi:fused signal recognition particle receptor
MFSFIKLFSGFKVINSNYSMFGGLKKLFRKAEEEIEEKVEASPEAIEELPEEIKSPEEEPTIHHEEIASPVPEENAEASKEADARVEKKVKIGFGKRLKTAMGGKARLSESEIENITWELQMGLMQSDVAMEAAEAISRRLKERFSEEQFSDPKSQVRRIFKETLVEILEAGGKLDFMDYIKNAKKPVRIVFFGINGTGKTTTIAKVAHKLKAAGYSVVLAAGDTFRAGAQEQLGVHAGRVWVKMVHHQRGGDAAAVVFDAIKHAEANKIDVVLVDTSGRMQSDSDLMGEMEKIVRVNKPDLGIFIGDALAGNDAVEQARVFNERIGIDASILSKVDASKGGAALSISYITKKPVIFLGMGQGYGDLEKFDAKGFVDEIV